MKYYHFEFINRNEKTYLQNVPRGRGEQRHRQLLCGKHAMIASQHYRQLISMSYHLRVIAIFGFAPSSAIPQLPLLA